jgi:hypothetical protein
MDTKMRMDISSKMYNTPSPVIEEFLDSYWSGRI